MMITATVFADNQKQNDQGKPHHAPPRVPKELLEKYDTNKDGKLDKSEREKISPEDKQKFKRPPKQRRLHDVG